ncbi:MAG TPA: hypothetical protein VFS58_06730 [Steroidobacteraceae bacterium]|nr:hypothetical protein [Steroidobacteraceae bacterium]
MNKQHHTITALLTVSLLGMAASGPSHAADTTLDRMPAALETQFALSAAPPGLRAKASVYLLDPKKGYYLAREGTSGVACAVQRTQWEFADFRNDIYYGLCYDAAGVKTYLQVVFDAAALRAQGMSPAALKSEIEKRFRDKTYQPPAKPGLSYMVGPIMRTIGPPDLTVQTMAMPHLMFYAPNLTNEDIGAMPNLSDHASLIYPFVDKQGIAEHTYMIQLIGEAEKTKILADETPLIEALCAYRALLCLSHHH